MSGQLASLTTKLDGHSEQLTGIDAYQKELIASHGSILGKVDSFSGTVHSLHDIQDDIEQLKIDVAVANSQIESLIGRFAGPLSDDATGSIYTVKETRDGEHFALVHVIVSGGNRWPIFEIPITEATEAEIRARISSAAAHIDPRAISFAEMNALAELQPGAPRAPVFTWNECSFILFDGPLDPVGNLSGVSEY